MDISRLQTQGQLTVSYVCLPSSVVAHRGYRWTGSLYEVLALVIPATLVPGPVSVG